MYISLRLIGLRHRFKSCICKVILYRQYYNSFSEELTKINKRFETIDWLCGYVLPTWSWWLATKSLNIVVSNFIKKSWFDRCFVVFSLVLQRSSYIFSHYLKLLFYTNMKYTITYENIKLSICMTTDPDGYMVEGRAMPRPNPTAYSMGC